MLTPGDYLARALLDEGLVDQATMDHAVRYAAAEGIPLEEALITTGKLGVKDLAKARAMLCECPFADLEHYDIDLRNTALVPRGVAEKLSAFPLFNLGESVTVGMVDPLNLRAIDQLRQIIRADIEPVLCVPSALMALIAKAYSLGDRGAWAEETRDEAASRDVALGDEPIVAAVNQIISDAAAAGASDIHISPCEHELQLRYRIDGILQTRQGPPLSAHAGLVQRLKVMANLDLTQTRRPQDGKFRVAHGGEPLEVRLSTIPTVCGENVVMRLLRPSAEILDFEQLGIDGRTREILHDLIERPHGMILVTGPTGSGKTSTLYTAIKRLNTPGRNIMTIEDPVEIRLRGVRQIQANPEIGMTFAGALRSILRQDPDIVLVGEIRDPETALIATQASLTGHMVLSTLHTNDAAGAIARLKDLGVPAFIIVSSLLGVIAQRLVRKVCRECAEPSVPETVLLRRFRAEDSPNAFVRGAGCARCGRTGYRGRIGVYELLRMNPAISARIEAGDSTQQIARLAEQHGMTPLWRDGLVKATAHITSLEEVARAVAARDLEGEPESALRLSA